MCEREREYEREREERVRFCSFRCPSLGPGPACMTGVERTAPEHTNWTFARSRGSQQERLVALLDYLCVIVSTVVVCRSRLCINACRRLLQHRLSPAIQALAYVCVRACVCVCVCVCVVFVCSCVLRIRVCVFVWLPECIHRRLRLWQTVRPAQTHLVRR